MTIERLADCCSNKRVSLCDRMANLENVTVIDSKIVIEYLGRKKNHSFA